MTQHEGSVTGLLHDTTANYIYHVVQHYVIIIKYKVISIKYYECCVHIFDIIVDHVKHIFTSQCSTAYFAVDKFKELCLGLSCDMPPKNNAFWGLNMNS